jgi:hypothetical protein
MHGNVHGGQQPIKNATITVYAVGTTGYGSSTTALASTTSDVNGNFSFSAGAYTCPQADTPTYILSSGGDPGAGNNPSAMLAAGLGTCTQAKSATVDINEVTTAATAYALAQFFTNALGASSPDSFGGPSSTTGGVVTYTKGLVNANSYTLPTLVDLAAGTANTSNTAVTVESAKLYTIANILASCINSTGATSTTETTTPCGQLFAATTPPGSLVRPSDTLQAAVQMAHYPYNNVQTIFNLASAIPPFAPALATVNDWTLGVKYTSSSLALTVTPGTTSNIDIDASGNIWLPSTAPAGVAMFSPATGAFSGPFTVVGVIGPQNIAINSTGIVYAADLGSGLLTAFNPNGSTAGTFNTLLTSQGNVAIGPQDQIWLTATNGTSGSSTIMELNGGALTTQANLLTGTNVTSKYTTSIAVQPNNDLYLATTAAAASYIESFRPPSVGVPPVDSVATSNGAIGLGQIANNSGDLVVTGSTFNTACSLSVSCSTSGAAGMNGPQGIATDGANNIWIANSVNASISSLSGTSGSFSPFSSTAYLHDATNGNTMTTPYGIAVDGSGNVWVSNQTAAGGPYVLSEVIGAAAPTITPLSAQIVGGVNLIGTKPTN